HRHRAGGGRPPDLVWGGPGVVWAAAGRHSHLAGEFQFPFPDRHVSADQPDPDAAALAVPKMRLLAVAAFGGTEAAIGALFCSTFPASGCANSRLLSKRDERPHPGPTGIESGQSTAL